MNENMLNNDITSNVQQNEINLENINNNQIGICLMISIDYEH